MVVSHTFVYESIPKKILLKKFFVTNLFEHKLNFFMFQKQSFQKWCHLVSRGVIFLVLIIFSYVFSYVFLCFFY